MWSLKKVSYLCTTMNKNMHTREEQMKAFGRLLDVLDQLREKCPWDKKQTNESLRPNTIEETYELCDAIARGDEHDTMKELGDVLMHVCFYARIGQEQGQFDIADVLNTEADKLIFRHPHIYHPSQVGAPEPKPLPYGSTEDAGNTEGADEAGTAQFSVAKTAEQVLQNWEQIKLKEKDGNKRVLSGVPAALPSVIKAYRIQDKARNVGFDWEKKEDVWTKVREELGELEEELRKPLPDDATDEQKRALRSAQEGELGDFLFSLINAARLYKLNPDNALEQTNAKFIRRFTYIEEHSIRVGKPLTEMTLAEMDALWEEAKQFEKNL
jgi:XTP/dITP diphosphohydrolase